MNERLLLILLLVFAPEVFQSVVLIVIEWVDASLGIVSANVTGLGLVRMYSLEIFGDITVFFAIRTVSFPELGKRNFRSLCSKCGLKASNKVLYPMRLSPVRGGKEVQGIDYIHSRLEDKSA
jgi:hypothetical protein